MIDSLANYNFLQFFKFKDIYLWDAKRLLAKELIGNYSFEDLGKHINEESHKIKPLKKSEDDFAILGVNNKIGLFDAYIEKSKNINQPYQIVKDGWLAYNPYRINVGSIGLKTEKQKYNLISNAYVVFSCKETLLPEYLFTLFISDTFNKIIRESTSGSVRQNLTFDLLSEIKIPLPPKDVQRRLVDAYQSAMSEVADATRRAADIEQSIENYLLDELGIEIVKNEIKQGLQFVSYKDVSRWSLEAILGEAVQIIKDKKYPLRKFGTLCTSKSGGTPSKGVAKYWKGTIPWVSPKDMKVDFISQAEDTISKEAVKESSAPLLEEGSLLMVVRSGILQRMLPVAINLVPVSINQDMRAFKLTSDEISIHYLFLYLKYSQKDVLRMVKSSTTVESIDSGNIDEFEIPLPPLPIQERIVGETNARREQIKSLRETAKRKREQAKAEFEKALFEI